MDCVCFKLRFCFVLITVLAVPADFQISQYSNRVLNNPATEIDSIRITQPPRYLQHNFPLNIEYNCKKTAIIRVEVQVSSESQDQISIFRHRLNCSPLLNQIQTKLIRLKLPRYIAYRPDALNRYSVYVDHASLRLWMSDPKNLTRFDGAFTKQVLSIQVLQPYDRPQGPKINCAALQHFLKGHIAYRPVSKLEQETVSPVTFPLVLSGAYTGVHRKIDEYNGLVLKNLRRRALNQPRFTIVVWLYITDYCPAKSRTCSIIQHITWDDRLLTPIINVNHKGQVHVEFILQNGEARAYLTSNSDFIMPKRQWVQLTVACSATANSMEWKLYLNYGHNFEIEKQSSIVLHPADRVHFDDVDGLLVLGGSELNPSFQGYIGQAIYYRRRLLTPSQMLYICLMDGAQITKPKSDHLMFELGLNQRDQKCHQYLTDIHYVIYQAKAVLVKILEQKTCPSFESYVAKLQYSNKSKLKRCKVENAPRSKQYKFVYGVIRRWVLSGRKFVLEEVAGEIVKRATYILETDDMKEMGQIISLLKQGSCFGNHDATFMLSVILNYGLTVKSNEIQSHAYLMHGALDGNRLCLLSLGNKHIFGLDGIPVDTEQAYVYYNGMAAVTRMDMEAHKEGDVYTEMVRLTDEAQVTQHTDEKGDLFMWVKHQAAQGVLTAQQHMARMLYWGSQGVERNISTAVKYYREAATSGDAVALYDYGIVLMKGHGVEKNLTKAAEVLEQAAEQNHSQALNTVGWLALEIEKNLTKAAAMFEKSYKLGNKDAGHNLAHMFLNGIYPGSAGVDRVRAWDYISAAASRGNHGSAMLVALYNMRGHPKVPRNPTLAVEWARYVAELNPAVGRLLTKGVKAYRLQQWSTALVYYLMAASTGIEVANFNLAFLCDENYNNISAYIEKDCRFRHYNLSIQRSTRDNNPYAYIKMADYYYEQKNMQSAASMYSSAAVNGDPHGLFSMALLVEEGVLIADATWKRLNIPHSIVENSLMLLTHLYTRCRDSHRKEAYLPCAMALYRVQALSLWQKHHLWIVTSFLAWCVVSVTILLLKIYRHINRTLPTNVL